MLKINNFVKLVGFTDGDLHISNVLEHMDYYFFSINLSSQRTSISITINRNKRIERDPKAPGDPQPIYDMRITQLMEDSITVKNKDLGIKKRALQNTNNIIKGFKEILDDFINNR